MRALFITFMVLWASYAKDLRLFDTQLMEKEMQIDLEKIKNGEYTFEDFIRGYEQWLKAKGIDFPDEIKLRPKGSEPPVGFPEADSYMNVSELITSKGYGCEEHQAITSDHFVLSLQRVISPTNPAQRGAKVVFLQHGLLDSSTTWVMNQAENSLGFMLADQGFDVWMGNSRGNRYSDTNTKLKKWRRKFWDWSWDEMAEYDLPTNINYITSVTGADQLYYVGHSQGTLQAFTGFSENKKIEQKVKRMFALAPIATVGHAKGLIAYVAYMHGVVYFWENLLGNDDILPSTPWSREFGRTYCDTTALTCEYLTMETCGPDYPNFNQSRADVYFAQFPAGTSLKNVNHWAQMIVTNKCEKYNYGLINNELHYGQDHPPKYDLSKVTVPVALYSGLNDWLADPADVQQLREMMSQAIVYDKVIDYFNHLDFVWGLTAWQEVYEDIISQIKAY